MVLRFQRASQLSQAILFSTDTSIKANVLVSYYKARFQIEFVFRDGKQYTGLIDCQARAKKAIHTHANASLSCLNIMKLEDRINMKKNESKVISISSWKRKKYHQRLMKKIFKTSKLNVEKIGNIVPQLHIHIIARKKTDTTWPLSVWVTKSKPYTEKNLRFVINKISEGFSKKKR